MEGGSGGEGGEGEEAGEAWGQGRERKGEMRARCVGRCCFGGLAEVE